jgi:hypothetical protein
MTKDHDGMSFAAALCIALLVVGSLALAVFFLLRGVNLVAAFLAALSVIAVTAPFAARRLRLLRKP